MHSDCEMSHRSLEEQLEELLDLADLCPVYFRKPLLAIYFANGVMQQMAGEHKKHRFHNKENVKESFYDA